MSGPRFLYNFTTPRLGVELPRNEHDAESGFVAINLIQVRIEVLAPEGRLLVLVVEHVRPMSFEILGYTSYVGAVFTSKRETHVVLKCQGTV